MRLFRPRILLRAFALGLAAVWLVGGLRIARRDMAVDLPKTSEDVLYVFPREDKDIPRRAGGYGVEQAHYGCIYRDVSNIKTPTIKQLPSVKRSELRFRVTNTTDCDLFLPYGVSNGDPNQGWDAYGLECPDKNDQRRWAGPDYDFGPEDNVLKPGHYFIFAVTRPTSKDQCILSVGYFDDSRAEDVLRTGRFYTEWTAEEWRATQDSRHQLQAIVKLN